MQLKELRKKSDKELHVALAEHREQLRDVRFKVSQQQYRNYMELKDIKKVIAQILTVLKEKELFEKVTANTK